MHKVSACLIVKNDPQVARAVESVRAYVDEVCIVDTGSTDGETAEISERIADKYERFTGCNFEDWEISDFSAARTRSFALASHDTVLWLDSDDIVEGAEHLQEAIAWAHGEANGQPWRAVFGYDYDQDERGRCMHWQTRERLVYPKESFHWVYRVHEGLTCVQANEWRTLEPLQPIVWRHHLDKTKRRSQRNLRILRDHVKQVGGPDNVDIKTTFDLGMEYAKSGDHNLAIAWLIKYIAHSDIHDDRLLACLQLVDVLSFWPGREQDALRWAHQAVDIKPTWPDGYWALAKLSYTAANKARGNPSERRHLERAAHFARLGLAQEEPKTNITRNPLDRSTHVQSMLQEVLTRLGDHRGALEAQRVCAATSPEDVAMQLRLRECERAVAGPMPSGCIDVVIMCGITREAWDPETAAARGIGGSETAVIEMGKRLAKLNCRVRVYCRCDNPGLYDGVEYRSMGEANDAAGCDLLIAWRNATLLETTEARVKWLWLHDTDAFGATPWNLAIADRILCLSRWHADHAAQRYPEQAHKITQTRNGIDLARFDVQWPIERHPHRAIYSSSPDRGLDAVLAMWPRIREHVPDAELHVFYGFAGFSADDRQRFVDRMGTVDGVVVRDRVDQATLAREMLAAGAWLHPSWSGEKPFFETSCIGAMEAQAAGLHVVASGWGALSETIRNGSIIEGAVTDGWYQQQFVEQTVVALQAEDTTRDRITNDARQQFGWDPVAYDWRAMAFDDLRSLPMVTSPRAASDNRPTLHFILAPQASGYLVMNAAADPGAEAHGGGSRVGFLGLVKAMAERGDYRVRAFSTFLAPKVERDGVEYVRLDLLRSYDDPDIAFAFYDTSPLASFGPKTLRIASHHTYSPYMHFDSADVNTAPSQHALEALRRQYDPTGSWRVLPNAVGPMAVERRPVFGRIIYHTSPDRGLHDLLRAYTAIKRAVPQASLHIVGGVQEILDAMPVPGPLGDRSREIREAYAQAAECGGVKLLGRLSRADLWRELGEASVFAFPCSPAAPCETFSISLMECCRIGLPVVLSPADALESIYDGHVRMIPAPAQEHLDEFASAVAEVLSSEREQSRLAESGKALAANYTFANEAAALDSIIREFSVSKSVAAA